MSSSTLRFTTRLALSGERNTGIVVPPEVLDRLGAGARPAVAVKVNGYAYRTTVGSMNGKAMLPFSAAHREASGIAAGDALEVELALDTQPRIVEVPKDLAAALAAARPALTAAFDKLAPSRRKADVENVLGAKTPETRARRIAAIVKRLADG